MRLRGATKSELSELGIDTEGMSNGIKSIVKQFKAMADIDIMEGTNYKSTFRIMDELADKWADLTDAERAAITESVAGKRGGSVMSSLMMNWNDARNAVQKAADSYGSAAKEQEAYAESVQYSIDRTKASLEELATDFLSSSFLKSAIEGANKLINLLDKLTDSFGGLSVIIAGLGLKQAFLNFDKIDIGKISSSLSTLFGATANEVVKKISKDASEQAIIASSIAKMNTAVAGTEKILTAEKLKEALATTTLDAARQEEILTAYKAKTANQGLSASYQSLGASVKESMGALLANPITWVVGAIAGVTAAALAAKRANDELRDSAKELGGQYVDTKNDIESYKGEITDLREKLNDSNTSEEEARDIRIRLLEIQDELIEKYGKEADAIKMITDATNGSVDALDKLSDKQWQVIENEFNNQDLPGADWLMKLTHGASDNIGVMLDEMENASKTLDLGGVSIDTINKIKKAAGEAFDSISPDQVVTLKGSLEDVYQSILDIQGVVDKEQNPRLFDQLTEKANKAKEDLNQYKDFYNQWVLQNRVFDNGAIEDIYSSYTEKFSKYREALSKGDEDGVQKYIDDLYKARNELEQTLTDKVASEEITPAVKASIIQAFAGLYPELQAEFDQMDFKLNTPSLKQLAGMKISANDLFKDLTTSGTSSAESIFNHILEQADQAGIVYGNNTEKIKQLIEYLTEWEILQGEIAEETQNTEIVKFDIQGLATTGASLKNIQKLYADFRNEVENESPTIHLDLTEVESLRSEIAGIVGEEDFNIFENIVTDANSSAEEIQAAFDNIATSFANAQIDMQGATEQTSAILKSQLVEWGFTKESVDAFVDSLIAEARQQEINTKLTIIAKDENNAYGNSTEAKLRALVDEATQLGLTKDEIEKYLIEAEKAGYVKFSGDTSFLAILRDELGLSIDQINNYRNAIASLNAGYSSVKVAGHGNTSGTSKLGAGSYTPAVVADPKKTKEKQKETKAIEENTLKFDQNSEAIKSNNRARGSSGGGGGGGSKAADEAKEEKDALQELSSQLDEVQDAWKKLSDIQKDYTKTGKITVDQAQELINIDYRYLAMLNLEGDAMAVNEAAFQSLAEAKLNEMKITLIRKAIDLVNTFVDEAKAAEYLTNSYFYLGAGAAQAAGELAALYQAVANVSGMSATQAQAANTVLQGTLNALKMLDHVDLSTAKGDSSEAAENAKDNYENLFDYFERRVKVLQNAVSLLNAELENVNGSFAKNKLLDAQGKYNEQMLKDYTSALEMYQEMADRALDKLPSDIADKVKNGAVEITKFMGEANEEVTEAIKDYENWADKVADCRQQIAGLKEALRQLELQKFNNIVEEFTAQFDIRQNGAIDLISKQIDLFSEAGQLIGTSFYAEQKNQTLKNIDLLQREKEALVRQMNSALDNGVTAGTDEWQEMVTTLSNVEGQILDAKKAVEEFDNAILALHTEIFERIQNVFAGFNDELDNLNSVLEDFDVAEENGTWSKEGLARLGIASQQYEMAKYQVKQYDKELQQLNDDYLAGRYSVTEYTDRLIELKGAQWDAVLASEAAKDAIADLNKARTDIQIEGINKEVEAYEELINAQKEALDAERDLYEFRRSIEEKSKNIASIQKQLAAIANDDSASARAQRARLQQQLTDAQDDLTDFQYKHSIDTQKEALDKSLEDFRTEKDAEIEKLNEYLENTEQLMLDSFITIKENAAIIGQELNDTAARHGVEISESLTNAWKAGENAIANYGAVLSSGSSAFIGELEKVEFKTWELKAQADNTAEGLAQMFATNADYLISELQASYDSEENLDAMTNALHANLIDTLESGYDVSGITGPIKDISNAANDAINALNGMQSAAGAAKDAANSATDAINRMNSAKSSSPSPSSSSSGSSQKWYAKTYDGSVVKDFSSYSEAEEWRKKSGYGTYLTSNKKYATGLRKADKDELAWTQELGAEAILSPTRSAVLTPIKAGDSVLTKAMTDNLWSWAKMSPEEMFAKQELPQVPMVNNIQNNQSMNFGSMVTINGPVNDSLEMMKAATAAAQREVAAGFKKLNNGLYS